MSSIVRNLKIVFLLTILAKIASFLSEVIIANYLGTSNKADAYSMIAGIHAVIYPMLGIGIWSIFLPKYQKQKTISNVKATKEYSDKVITIFIMLSSAIALFVFVFADWIIAIASPGFDGETKNIAASLLRIYSPYFVFSTISSVYAAMLQSHGKFLGSQLREFVSYLPTIILGPVMYLYIGVSGFAIALVIGSILRLVIQFPFINWGYRYKPNFRFKDRAVISLFKKSPAAIITSSSDQILTLVDKIMASTLAVGSVASLNYGSKLTNAINGVLTNSVSTVLFPEMPKMIARKEYKNLAELTRKVLVSLAIIIIPIMTIMLLFSGDIVRLVYARGSFDENSVAVTTTVFCGYLVGFYFIGIKQITDKIFYSLDKNNTVMIFNIINVVVNIVLNIVLIGTMGLSGLAYATSIASTLYIIICLAYLKHSKISFDVFSYIKKLLTILLINVIPIVGAKYAVSSVTTNWIISLLLTVTISGVIIIASYNIFKVNEYLAIQDRLLKKTKK